MNREETKQDELILIKNVGYFHPDLLGIKMGDTGESVADDNNVPVKQPDPITGLVPCGCGGKAKLYHYGVEDAFRYGFPDDEWWLVYCDDCGIETGNEETESKAITAWNTAMGYRG
jgi:hypothetical protein